MDAKKTGSFIAALRRERGLSQKELAAELGVTDKAVSRWETGRGYPDVALLPRLAKALDVSITELLEGERATPEEPAGAAEEQMEFLCLTSGAERKRWKLRLAAVIAAVVLLWLPGLLRRAQGFVDSVVGSPECVIAADYSSLTYYGERYVPLIMGDVECAPGTELIDEAQVEGMGFWGKLLFGEKLWSIKGVPDYEIVYLQTDYDECASCYFVLETAREGYETKLAQLELSALYAVYEQPDGLEREFRMDAGVIDALNEAAAGTPAEDSQWAQPLWRVELRSYDSEHLVYRLLGELCWKDGRYFWAPSRPDEQTGGVTYGLVIYPVEGELFPES